MEQYLECFIVNKDKIHHIEETFKSIGFKATFKSDDRIAFIKENTYFEYYRDTEDTRYIFHLITEDQDVQLYTYEYDKIDSKIKQIINKIGAKNETTTRNSKL